MLYLYINSVATHHERELFEQLYVNYKRDMIAIAMAILKDFYLAEDAMHKACLKIIKHLEKFKNLDSHKQRGLIVIIIKHTSIDMLRQKNAEQYRLVPLDENTYGAKLMSGDVSADDYNVLLDLLADLDEQQAMLVHLRCVYGYSYSEIAEIMDATPSAVRKRMERIRATLRETLRRDITNG